MDDAIEHKLRLCVGEDGGIAVRPHATGIRPGIAIEDSFMILSGSEWDNVAPVAERDEADLLAAQEFFDYQPAGQRGERGFGFGLVVHDDDSFAGGEAVGFQDHWEAEPIDGAAGGSRAIDAG